MLNLILVMLSMGSAQSFDFGDFLQNLEDQVIIERSQCASKNSQIGNISGLTKKVSLWGTWKANANGKSATVTMTRSSGTFKAKAKFDGKTYGPFTIKLCDYDSYYTGSVFGFSQSFSVVNSRTLRVNASQFGLGSITLRKQ